MPPDIKPGYEEIISGVVMGEAAERSREPPTIGVSNFADFANFARENLPRKDLGTDFKYKLRSVLTVPREVP